jgi:hypothetical protein
LRASRAYIAGLGTTGVLIASGLLLLVVVSTIVAFNGWPGQALVKDLESLMLGDDKPALTLSGPAQVAADAAPAAAAVATTAAPGSAAAAPTGTSVAPGTDPLTITPGAGGGQGQDPGIIVPTDTPLPPNGIPGGSGGGQAAPGLPGEVQNLTNNLGRTTEGVTGALGDTVGQVNPQLGETVTETGQSLSDLVQGLGLQTSP